MSRGSASITIKIIGFDVYIKAHDEYTISIAVGLLGMTNADDLPVGSWIQYEETITPEQFEQILDDVHVGCITWVNNLAPSAFELSVLELRGYINKPYGSNSWVLE